MESNHNQELDQGTSELYQKLKIASKALAKVIEQAKQPSITWYELQICIVIIIKKIYDAY